MKSADTLQFRGTVGSRGDASAYLKSAGDAVLVQRERPRLLVISCPCGCGEEFPINLDPRSGPAWRLYGSGQRGLSLFPSVWRESGCKSHYIIWRNKILLFGGNEEEFDSGWAGDERKRLAKAVVEWLPATGLMHFAKVAERLNEVPWDVLQACRDLVRMGRAREGVGKERGHFGLVVPTVDPWAFLTQR